MHPIPPAPDQNLVAPAADGSYISKPPGVMGGDACIRMTRIPVWLLVSYRRQGVTAEELMLDYPGLCAADLEAVWAHDRDNPGEIDAAIAAQDQE